MKKAIVMSLGICLITLGAAYAEPPKDNCGCGWGSMAFEGKDGIIFQVLAATTNGTFGNQTFGITSGTAGCEKPASWTSNEELNHFVAENMDNIARDVAAGQGEYLDSLAELMAVPAKEKTEFTLTLQDNFSEIFSDAVTHVDVLENIVKVYPVS